MDRAHHGTAFHGGEHYENFPVGSWLVPPAMRPAILALYRFARTGDDLADEGDLPITQRLTSLNALRCGLLGTPNTDAEHEALWSIGASLRAALSDHSIGPAEPEKLLAAFMQDAHNLPLQTEAEVLDYCSRSANPIGRLFLALAGVTKKGQGPDPIAASDAICTGLQLANFAQDMAEDVARHRFYIPDAWWSSIGLTDRDQIGTSRPAELVRRMAEWAQHFLLQGQGLPAHIRASGVPGARRLAIEIALCVEGGLAISRAAARQPLAVWHQPPTISRGQLPMLLLRSLRLAYAAHSNSTSP